MKKEKLKEKIANLEWQLSFQKNLHNNELKRAKDSLNSWRDRYFDLLDEAEKNAN